MYAEPKEYKVVCFQEQVQFLTSNPKKAGGKSFSVAPHEELFQFASQALQDLKVNCHEFISDGLVRIDIFQNRYGKFVVNEFETLEANYESERKCDFEMTSAFTEKLTAFWLEKIQFFCIGIIKN